jgi:hypothetical protein
MNGQVWCPGVKKKHFQIVLATDSSKFKMESFYGNPKQNSGVWRFLGHNDIRPIHVKEASALLNYLSLVWIGFKTKELKYIDK